MKKFLPIILFFIATNAFFLLAKDKLAAWHMDQDVVLVGNIILFLATLASGILYSRAAKNEKPLDFMQQFYGGFMLKFFVLILAVAIYLFSVETPNQNGILLCMGLYLIYHFLSTMMVTRRTKRA